MKRFFSRALDIVKESFQHPLRSSFLLRSYRDELSIYNDSMPKSYIGEVISSPSDDRELPSLRAEIEKLKKENNDLKREEITPKFKLIFIAVFSLTLLFFMTSVALAIFISDPNENQQEVFSNCVTLSQWGFVAIIGLIGGKAL
ncbi:MAG: hypothetical protein ACFB0G_11895 [Leptolyngbyaceae cyanobacterium]